MGTKKRIAAGLTGTAIVLGGNQLVNSGEAPQSKDGQVICEVTVSADSNNPTNTVSGLADTFGVGQSQVKVYHPGSATPEKDPVYEMQPGDTAVAKLGAAACYAAGGMPGNPEHPNTIIE
jgi:hypothetical protein